MKNDARRHFPEIIALILLLCCPFLGLGEADGRIMSPSQKAVLETMGEIRTLSVGPLGLPRYVSGHLGFLPDGSEAGARAYLQRVQGLWRGTGHGGSPAAEGRNWLGSDSIVMEKILN